MKTQIKCPQCHTMAIWKDNPHRPFCSERCKLLDLGQWADESYRIQGTSRELLSEEDVGSINNGKTRH